MNDQELDLVETSALIAALRRRSEGSVVVLLRDHGDEDEKIELAFSGGETVALGLIHRARLTIEERNATGMI